LLGPLGVVPAVDGAHQVAGDAADALEVPALADEDLLFLFWCFLRHDDSPPYQFTMCECTNLRTILILQHLVPLVKGKCKIGREFVETGHGASLHTSPAFFRRKLGKELFLALP